MLLDATWRYRYSWIFAVLILCSRFLKYLIYHFRYLPRNISYSGFYSHRFCAQTHIHTHTSILRKIRIEEITSVGSSLLPRILGPNFFPRQPTNQIMSRRQARQNQITYSRAFVFSIDGIHSGQHKHEAEKEGKSVTCLRLGDICSCIFSTGWLFSVTISNAAKESKKPEYRGEEGKG